MRLVVLRGLPASGKSTYARELMAKSGNMIRVNRDDLRPMLHGGAAWSNEREKATVSAEIAIVEDALRNGRNVIVDDTNILGRGPDLWKEQVVCWNRQLQIEADEDDHNTPRHIRMDITDLTHTVSIEECITRDAAREGKARVGRGVIERMALFGGLIDLSKEDKVAIIDVDGTLANLDHRLWHLNAVPKDYDGFFHDVPYDGKFDTIISAVSRLADTGHYIIILSGRPTTVGHETAHWLESVARVPYKRLFMRNSGDHRPDHQVKRQLMEQMFRSGLRKESIKVIIDDRDSVCAVWTELGLPLIQVDHGTCVKVAPNAVEALVELRIPVNYSDKAT